MKIYSRGLPEKQIDISNAGNYHLIPKSNDSSYDLVSWSQENDCGISNLIPRAVSGEEAS